MEDPISTTIGVVMLVFLGLIMEDPISTTLGVVMLSYLVYCLYHGGMYVVYHEGMYDKKGQWRDKSEIPTFFLVIQSLLFIGGLVLIFIPILSL